jgi:hypothetical protein
MKNKEEKTSNGVAYSGTKKKKKVMLVLDSGSITCGI